MSNNGVNTKYALTGVLTSAAGEAFVLASHSGGLGTIVAAVAGLAVYSVLKDTKEAGGDFPLPAIPPLPTRKPRTPGELSLAYRLVHGKSTRGEETIPDEASEQSSKAQGGTWIPPQFTLESVLDVVRTFNAQGSIYFGESVNGAIAIPLDDMYHVMDVSSSGKGKSNRFRLAMLQMVESCETYYINPFAASVKSVKDDRKIEVWQPIYDRLANKQPIKAGSDILRLMTFLAKEIIRRNDQEEQGDFSWQDRPIFVFIDELPEVFARCPQAVKLLDAIGRTGRNYSVFAWVASQTALVEEIGQSTAAQANYKTRIYGGGDKTSCHRLMKGSVPKDAERTLQTNGAGLSLMLADGMEEPPYVRAPLITNEGLFEYYELPPFQIAAWLTPLSRQPVPRGDEQYSIYRQPSQGNAEMPIYSPVNAPVNDSTSRMTASPPMAHLHLLPTDVNEPVEGETSETSAVNVNVNAEVRDVIQRLHDQGIRHNVIAKAVRLDGRRYDIYKQVCREMGIEKEA